MIKQAILLAEPAPFKQKRPGRKKGSKNRPKEEIPSVNRRKNRGEYEFNSEDEVSKEPMSPADIKALLNKFLALPVDNNKNNSCVQKTYMDRLFTVMLIIEKREQINFKQCDNEDCVEIEFSSFKPATLRELEKYINSCLGIGIVKKPFIPKTLEQIRERKKILEEELAKLDRHVPMQKRLMYARRALSSIKSHTQKGILNRQILRPLSKLN